ncbi:MAG: hypothetical protein OHK93_008797 [Ramalina farinacea]|uniref:Uncharacterized protein n=1 Tax=Ramalina farinacea TaxID=258253 RepID=A0AA43QRE9_9LECA|nr:hypothetical protein [Ramalina farinacea]
MEKEEDHQALAELVQAMNIEQSMHVSLTTPLPPPPFPKKVVPTNSSHTQAKPILPYPLHHLHTLWLFTVNDIKSILIPQSAFGIITALSGPLLTTNPSPSLSAVLSTLPRVLLWTYLNLLTFDISNQRLPTSLVEDSVNKPWRALPSKRLSMAQARRLLCFLIPCVIATTFWLGGCLETLVMMSLTWMYNDLHGADEHYAIRNLINAAGFMTYNYGTSRVAVGQGHALNSVLEYQWVPMVGGVVLTTLQMQDMSDQKGDAERGRGTLPLVWGDGVARWSIAVPVMIWSLVCPAFWQLGLLSLGFALPVMVGGVLAGRVLLLRGVENDKATWKVWCGWMMVLYALPLFKDHSVVSRALDGFAPFQLGSLGVVTRSAHSLGINVLSL